MQHHLSTWEQEREQEEEEEEDVLMQQVPLHLAERNLLTSHFPFKKQDLIRDDTIVVFTKKDNDVTKNMVLFPSAQKLEVLEKSREFKEDRRPETLEALKEMKRQAMTQIKREAFKAKASSTKAQNSNSPSTSSSGHKTKGKVGKNATIMTSNFQGREGYWDTYDWDHHHDLDPSFTFSRERHNQRMAMLAQMPEFQTSSPLTDINLPFQMDNFELFDRVDDSNETSVAKEFQSTTPNKRQKHE